MLQDDVGRAVEALRSARRVAAFTGAGVSAESGLATFRGAGGLWEGHRVEEVASPDAFAADPMRVWRFYDQRRTNAAKARPNPAHMVLAGWQDRFGRFTLATQNVDGLHQGAGSRGVIELHGSLWRVRCTGCGREREDRTTPLRELPPRCAACGAMERPGVVWFGEAVPAEAFLAAQAAVVYPAAGLVGIAAAAGATVIEVNPAASALAGLAGVTLRGPAGEMLPRVDALLAGG
ncbi:MAG: NAD-dependent deacylase [Acidobacteria bacterium]|nr:MAG: NAD-dependent deacylase [Acidobacteriota bacterium]